MCKIYLNVPFSFNQRNLFIFLFYFITTYAPVFVPGTGNSRDPGLSHFPIPGKKVSGIPGNLCVIFITNFSGFKENCITFYRKNNLKYEKKCILRISNLHIYTFLNFSMPLLCMKRMNKCNLLAAFLTR